MALPTFADLNTRFSLVLEHVFPGVKDNIFTAVPAFAWFRKSGSMRTLTGSRISEMLMYAGNATVDWIAQPGFGQVSVVPQETHGRAFYEWKILAGSVSISHFEEDIASGPEAQANLLTEKIKNLELSLKREAWRRVWATVGTEGQSTKTYYGTASATAQDTAIYPHSIPSIIREVYTGSNIVGTIDGISTGANSWWAGYAADGTTWGTAATCKSEFLTALLDLEAKEARPTVAFAGTAVFGYIMGAAQAMQQITDWDVAHIGFQSVIFQGVPVIHDAEAPTDAVYLLNDQYFNWNTLKGADFRTTEFTKPGNQMARTAQVYWTGELTTSNRRTGGVIFNITAS